MSVIVYTSNPTESLAEGRIFQAVLDHLKNHFPGTFILAVCRELGGEQWPHSAWDWVRLPAEGEGWGNENRMAAQVMEILGRRFNVPVSVFVGEKAAELLKVQDIKNMGKRLLVLFNVETTDLPTVDHVVYLDGKKESEEKLLALLDDLMVSLPFEITGGPAFAEEEVLKRVTARASKGQLEKIVLHWQGAPDHSLQNFIAALMDRFSATIRVNLLLSGMMDFPRRWLAAAPYDAIFNQQAWKRYGQYLLLVMTARRGVRLRIVTNSHQWWILAAVHLANFLTALTRSLFKFRAGRRR